MRPFLLSVGLALIWFVQFHADIEGDVPVWGEAALVAVRFFVDFVGALLAVSVLRLAFAAGRLAWIRLRALR